MAYGTECNSHLLNVPARDMSAFPEDGSTSFAGQERTMTGRSNRAAFFRA